MLGRNGGELGTWLKPVLEFINDVINRGQSVLVHCLAGAHRAGTTGREIKLIRILIIEIDRSPKNIVT